MSFEKVELLSSAWFGDKTITINFPENWDVEIVGNKTIPPLTAEQVKEKINNPIGTSGLSVLARNKSRAAIIIDDITRPTPTAAILPYIIEELEYSGFDHDSIIVVIASGTHKTASEQEIIKKLGEKLASKIMIIPHDCMKDMVFQGKTSRGTPLYVNKAVTECDLKIGVGCIYPHPVAGFSGGAKIILPGIVGIETARYLHGYIRGADHRGGSLDTEFRKEIEEVATRIGLDFIVNVVLNQKREVAGLFAGDKILAHREGVKFATKVYSIRPLKNADIIISDIYPFDTSLQFMYSRGFWPLMDHNKNVTKIAIASCPMGLGYHGLTTLSTSIWSRMVYRFKYFQLKEFYIIFRFTVLKILKRILIRRQQEFMVLSKGITKEELGKVLPGSMLFGDWDEILKELRSRHRNLPVKVAVYRCSPLLLPIERSQE